MTIEKIGVVDAGWPGWKTGRGFRRTSGPGGERVA
jgi:hypothetical protein